MNRKIQAAIDYFRLNVTTIQLVEESYSSTVRILWLTSGEKLVLKLPFNRNKVMREQKILTLLQGRLPVPRLIDGWLGDDEIPGALLLSYLPGACVKGAMTPNDCYAMGELLARLHMVKTQGFGDDYEQVSDASAWRQMFIDYLAEWPLLCEPILSPTLLQRTVAKYNELLAMLPPPDGPCIIHVDYRPGNILMENGKITGLIDFESARGGSAERDFCKIKEELWDIDPATRHPFLDGYQTIRPLPNLAQALPLCELQNALASLLWCLRRNTSNGPFWEHNMRALERITSE